jgi:hypothetical protein
MPDDPETWKVARRLVDHALDWGWDAERGGFYDKGDVFAGAAFDTTKVWWTQAEGLNALLMMHRRYGDRTDRYWEAFVKQWAFIEAHLLDAEHGGWFGEVTKEGAIDRRRPQGDTLEGELPHVAGPDEHGGGGSGRWKRPGSGVGSEGRRRPDRPPRPSHRQSGPFVLDRGHVACMRGGWYLPPRTIRAVRPDTA